MSLVFAAITPHTPLLVPTIGQSNAKKLEKTAYALGRLEEELYAAHPDMLIIISPHGAIIPDAFTVNFCDKYQTDLKEFGDLATKPEYKGETHLPYHIRQASQDNEIKTILISNPTLDHGVSVPLLYLLAHLPKLPIMPIGYSNLDWKQHLDFGYVIKEQIMKTNRRIAVIASGDLSHALSTEAPAGFNPQGPIFDAKVQEILSSHNTTGLLQLPPELLVDAAECGFRTFLILMGILRDINYKYESYAYENPFGVGHLTANFVL